MTEIVSLESKRKEKEQRCAICGGKSHEFAGQCPRVHSVTEEVDGGITYHFTPLDPDAA